MRADQKTILVIYPQSGPEKDVALVAAIQRTGANCREIFLDGQNYEQVLDELEGAVIPVVIKKLASQA
jgi:hypothetical protein